MVQVCLSFGIKHQFLQLYGAAVPIKVKGTSGLISKSDLNKRDMHKVSMNTEQPASTREATEILVKMLYITYAKADLKQVADNATQMNSEEITQLLRIREYFRDLFGGTLGD